MKALSLCAVTSVALSVVLVGCAGANRSDPGAFKEKLSGKINPADQRRFVECLMDGFDKAHWSLTLITTRQQVRSDTIRVETVNNSAIINSADVNNDGTVALYESREGELTNTTGERAAFRACLQKFGLKN